MDTAGNIADSGYMLAPFVERQRAMHTNMADSFVDRSLCIAELLRSVIEI